MAVVSPTPIAALPTPPVLSDLATFSTRTDAFINALPTFRNENNALATNVYNNAVDAAASATLLNSIVTNNLGTYTILTTDYTIIQISTASVYTLPLASSYTGRRLSIVTQFSGSITASSAVVVPRVGGVASTAILPATAGSWATLQSNGTSWVIIASS